jgi:uncharacterized membrane protein HdeD (DUF308 family)
MASMPSARSIGSALAVLRPKWGWCVALGIGLMGCGVIALLSIIEATTITVIWVGVMMVVAGMIEVVHGTQMKGWGRSILWIVTGALYIIGGFFAIVNPLLASVVLTLVLAIALIVAGIMRVMLGFHIKGGGHSGWIILSGALTLLFGLIVIAHWPLSSLYALGIILGVDLIQSGAGWLNLGLFLKRSS